MTHLKIRHLVSKPNCDGSVRFYWQATSRMQKAGMGTERLSNEFGSAIARAEELNSEWDRVRKVNIYREDRARVAKTIESAAGVYVIGPALGGLKIGMSADPTARLRDLQVANSTPLRLLFFVWCGDVAAAAVERRTHDALKRYRVRGEWFDISHERAAWTILAALRDEQAKK